MKFITIAAAGALIAGSAHAGGVNPAPVEPLVMNPAPPVIVAGGNDWTGGYAGLSLGYGVVDAEGSAALENQNNQRGFLDIDGDGVIGGAFAGYQQDFGNFVLGGEIDLNAANLDFDDDQFFGGDVDLNRDGQVDNGGASINQLHRAKLRLGYDLGNTLVYGVAGAAHAKAEILGNDYNDTGYVLGAGVDYRVTPNVVVGGEVLHHQFDDFDGTGIDMDATTVQARVAYKF